MIQAILKGALLGITIAFLIGPSFFALIQTAIQRGFKVGVQFAFGIILSDATLVALSYLGVLQLFNNPDNKFVVGIVGSGLLFLFGLYNFSNKAKVTDEDLDPNFETPKKGNALTYISKGYIMNIANPFLLVFWITAMGLASSQLNTEDNSVIYFFAATLATIFLTDVIKCYLSNILKKLLTAKIINLFNKIIGATLIIFGVILIFRTFMEF